MVGKVTITVDGTRRVAAVLKELGVAAANRIARSALNRGATPVVKRARELAPTPGDPDDPYATGRLKKAITKRLRRARRGSDKQEILIGIERPRSRVVHLLEFGSAHQSAEPFLRPALDETKGEVIEAMREAMETGIKRERQKLVAQHRTKAG
jgi:HK97 gp10 family phage protein